MFDVKPILKVHDHRPWPLPRRPWIMTQTWSRLLFLHYPVAPELIRPLVPSALPLDSYDSKAWISVTPFLLAQLRLRGLGWLPLGSRFYELNCRTYVSFEGKPGVFFFSLDASSWAAVLGARMGYGLPYFHAHMQMSIRDGEVGYRSRRRFPSRAAFQASYHPTGAVHQARPGELAYFLCERYCLYVVRGGKIYRTEIHHLPWPLQDAEANVTQNSLAEAAGVRSSLALLKDSTKFVSNLNVVVWAPERCG
jgi:uncharacterized protein YqjF (DUF2071 family)